MWFPPNRRLDRRSTLWRIRPTLPRQASRHRQQELPACSRSSRRALLRRPPRRSRFFLSARQLSRISVWLEEAWSPARLSAARSHLRRRLPRVRARREHLPMWFAPCRRRQDHRQLRTGRLTWHRCALLQRRLPRRRRDLPARLTGRRTWLLWRLRRREQLEARWPTLHSMGHRPHPVHRFHTL